MPEEDASLSLFPDLLDHLTAHSAVWISDSQEGWLKASVKSHEVVQKKGSFEKLVLKVVIDSSGEERTLALRAGDEHVPCPRNTTLTGDNQVQDLVQLSYLNEPSVLDALRRRYREETIYTYSGLVLAAINPYTPMPDLYTRERMSLYSRKNNEDDQNLVEQEPHVFAVAENAYRDLLREGTNQSIIISGESGAGKTVSARHIMRYFAAVDRELHKDELLKNGVIEEQIIATNPLLEAFGNAKTVRNDNSSRFGKFIQLYFQGEDIVGAKLQTFLLEKSRVTGQEPGERNYHIFHQLLTQIPSEHSFKYAKRESIAGVDDSNEFETTKQAMRQTGFTESQIQMIFDLLLGILCWGNIEFEEGSDEGAKVINSDDLDKACHLLGVETEKAKLWLTHKLLVTGRETVQARLNADQAAAARDSIARLLYARLFDYLIERLNEVLMPKQNTQNLRFIGVLDIYGFERFPRNSFEQFCINYANERLQAEFTKHVFKAEQELYRREGIKWRDIRYSDNQPCIELIESKLGVISLLEEECRFPGGSDASFREKLLKHQAGHAHLLTDRFDPAVFEVRHFAYDVPYTADGFLDKNRDAVPVNLFALFRESQIDLVKTICNVQSGHGSTKQGLAVTFKQSLNSLMEIISGTRCHYIRCIKPNELKQPGILDSGFVLLQLRACGIIETVRISAAGYPARWNYDEFALRYRILGPSTALTHASTLEHTKSIIEHVGLDDDQYQLGNERVFMRVGILARLEGKRTKKLVSSATCIQTSIRSTLVKMKAERLRSLVTLTQACVRAHFQRVYHLQMRLALASQKIQTILRGRNALKHFKMFTSSLLTIQVIYKSQKERKTYLHERMLKAATCIQQAIRMKAKGSSLGSIRTLQVIFKGVLAKKDLVHLRQEANSVGTLREKVGHLQKQLELLQQENEALKTEAQKSKELHEQQVDEFQARIKELESSPKSTVSSPVHEETLEMLLSDEALVSDLRTFVTGACRQYSQHIVALLLPSQLIRSWSELVKEPQGDALTIILGGISQGLKSSADDLQCAFWVVNLTNLVATGRNWVYEPCLKLASDILLTWTDELCAWFSKAAIMAIMDYQGLPGYTTQAKTAFRAFFNNLLAPFRPSNNEPQQVAMNGTEMSIDGLISALTQLNSTLTDTCFPFIPVLIQNVLESMACECFNTLFARTRLRYATWKRGVQIQYNLTRLLDWTTTIHLPHTSFSRLSQAAKLLQLAKSLEPATALTTIADACPDLSLLQIRRLLMAYAPDDLEVGGVSETVMSLLERWSSDLDEALALLPDPSNQLQTEQQRIKASRILQIAPQRLPYQLENTSIQPQPKISVSKLSDVLPASLWRLLVVAGVKEL